MKVAATIVLIWLICTLIGAAFHVIGQVLWVAALLTAVVLLWKYLQRNNTPE